MSCGILNGSHRFVVGVSWEPLSLHLSGGQSSEGRQLRDWSQRASILIQKSIYDAFLNHVFTRACYSILVSLNIKLSLVHIY
jgi:hypothetical protein